MSWDKIQFFIALLSLICLILSYYYASKKDKISDLDKGAMAFFSILILALSDRFKLLIWCVVVGIVWLIKHSKKGKKNEFT